MASENDKSPGKGNSGAAKNFYEDLIELSPMGFLILDEHGIIVETNPAYYTITGYRSEELIGRHISIISSKHNSTASIEKNIRDILSGRQLSHVVISRRKDGSLAHVRLSEKRITLPDGRPGVMSVAEDISGQREAEMRLLASEERFRKIFIDNEAPMLIINPGDQQILDANPAASRFYGYSRKELSTMNMGQINLLGKKEREHLMNRAVKRPKNYFQFRHRLASGEVRDVEVYASPIEVAGEHFMFIIVHDISERRQAARLLDLRMKQLEILLKLSGSINQADSPEAIFTFALNALKDGLGVERASILLMDENREMQFVDWVGLSEEYRTAVQGHSPWKPASRNPKPLYITDLEKDAETKEYLSVFKKESIRSIAFIPLTHRGRLIGKFMLYYNTRHHFSDFEKTFTQTLANQLAISVIRKRDEEELRASEQMYRSIIQASPDAIMSLDMKGNICFANAKAAALYGYKNSKSLIGRSGFDFVQKKYRKDAEKMIASAIREGEFHGIVFAQTRKGKPRTLEINAILMKDGEGRPFQFLSISRDISERLQAQEKLAESERLFRKVVEEAQDGMAMADVNGRYLLVNHAMEKMTGYSHEELLNMNVSDLLAPDEEVRLFPKIAAGDKGRRVAVLKRKDGSRFHAEVSGYPIEIGGTSFVMGQVRDISALIRAEEERRNLELQIQHAQKMESLGVLAGGIAHDFNNLLTGILGNIGLTEMQLTPAHPALQNIKSMESSAMRAADLCRQLLAYSGKGRFTIMSINLNEVVEEIGALLETSISRKVLLKYNLEENLPAVEVDTAQIQQVIMNLIINASDAIGKKSGIVAITTGVMQCDGNYLTETYLDDRLKPGPYVFLEVSDTGTGMSEETRQKIFDPFFSTKFTGRGLGLAAVLGIIRGHRGAIKVYSEPGKGSTFKVLLPVTDKAMESLVKPEKAMDNWRGKGGVLIVDDEETIRILAAETLKRTGMTPYMAVDGRQALDIFRAHQQEIKVVLLDMTMPRMDGIETFRELRRIKPSVKVILSSGYNEQDATNSFVGKGLAGFLQKPYKAARLIEMVRKVLK
ncbi:MAG TPA: PAS domain S-box protein [Caldithrix abyssi]|uniref:histidine kinase n=1 Tax=Caldithrix abyssi TaxID=187145 RepID=A0A7V5RQP8_CALAY|nr:PAS domain S-box protein [Caldithrix abyssi]